jgi:hypothetical protein
MLSARVGVRGNKSGIVQEATNSMQFSFINQLMHEFENLGAAMEESNQEQSAMRTKLATGVARAHDERAQAAGRGPRRLQAKGRREWAPAPSSERRAWRS